MNDRHEWHIPRRSALRGLLFGSATASLLLPGRKVAAGECATTQSVPIEGPYFLGAPQERAVTGAGLVITGRVLDAASCAPIAGATIIRWHANRFGIYEDYFRALMRTDAAGRYRMQSIVPGTYAGLQRHVHFRVSAPGHADLITQWQIADGLDPGPEILFDFVLEPV